MSVGMRISGVVFGVERDSVQLQRTLLYILQCTGQLYSSYIIIHANIIKEYQMNKKIKENRDDRGGQDG